MLTLLIFIIFLFFNYLQCGIGILILLIFQLCIIIYYSYKHYSKSISLIFFLLSFFTFFISQDLIFFLFSKQIKDIGLFVNINHDVQINKYNSIYLSLLFIYLGYSLFINKFKIYNVRTYKQVEESAILNHIKLTLLIFFYITVIFTLIKIATFGPAILSGGYAKLDNSTSVSQSINLLSFFNTFVYLVFLNCFPSKKELKYSLPSFLIVTVGSIAFGTRGDAVCTILFLLLYFLSRDLYLEETKRFLSRKIKIFLIIISPIALICLSLFAYIRSGDDIESHGFVYDIMGFFIQQGGTGKLILAADEYKSSLPQDNSSYTFGPLINLYNDYTSCQNPYHMDYLTYDALYGNNLGSSLTYLTNPTYYYSGGGLGTSYLAELYVDFGYLGIVTYSFFLGILLRYISFDVKKSLLNRIISTFILIGIFFLPRDFALNMTKLLTPAYLICIMGVLALYSYYLHKLSK